MKARTQIALVVDGTGSMRPVRNEVRRHNCRLIESAFRTIPSLEMAGIAVCDDLPGEGCGKLTTTLPFQRDWDKVADFFKNIPDAFGGDFDECYELGLHQLGEFKWNPAAKKVAIVFGDARPHPVNHRKNKLRLDWEKETEELVSQGVTIHAVHCLPHYGEGAFWKKLAKNGGGVYFQLDQASHVESLVLGIAHHTSGGVEGLQQYEEQLQKRSSIPTSVRRSFDTLAGRKSTVKARKDSRKPVDGSLFQVLTCDSTTPQDVKSFAVSQGLIAEPDQFNSIVKGHLFYAHTERKEDLRPSHTVVIQDLETDEMFSGEEARNWLDCPFGETKKIAPNPLGEKYRVWLQSKSVNRNIRPGQQVMVEMTEAMKDSMAEVEAVC